VTQAFRLPTGGIIDRSRTLTFEFDGTAYEGYAGDTLASALLANGVHFVARSFKYHRPRGILCSGSDEPSALVQLDRGARTEPNVRDDAGVVRRSGRGQSESVAVASLRCRGNQQRIVAPVAGRLLLQDLHVAADATLVAAL